MDVFKFLAHSHGHGAAVGTAEHHGRADHRFAAIHTAAAEAKFAADFHGGDLTDGHGSAAMGLENHRANILHPAQARIGAYEGGFAVAFHKAGAQAAVVAFQGADNILQRQPVALQRARVGQYVVLLEIAADGGHVGDIRYGAQLRTDDPVLHGAQIGEALDAVGEPFALGRAEVAVLFKLHRPHQHLAQAGGDRSHRRFDARRQFLARAVEPFANLLSRQINIHSFLKHRRHLTKAVA